MEMQSATKSAAAGRQDRDRVAARPSSAREKGESVRPGERPGWDRLAEIDSALNGGPRATQLKAMAGSLNPTDSDPAPAGRRANATGLPGSLKAGVEALSGIALDDVRVHYGSAEPARLQAHAFARGTDIHLAPGQERHLPHEAWHVVQQAQGRVKLSLQLKGGAAVNDDPGLEREADVMGSRSLAVGEGGSADALAGGAAAESVASPAQRVAQRVIMIGGKKVKEEEEVQKFFVEKGVHYYYSYNAHVLELINDDRARVTLSDAGDAVALARSFERPMTEGFGEAQEGVQRKLVEIAELFRMSQQPTIDFPSEYKKWYREMVLNGLCFGFVKIFEKHPEWLMAMWRTLEAWQPPHGLTVDQTLTALNDYIEGHMRFGDGQVQNNFLEAVLLAREAWDHMNDQEEEEDRDETEQKGQEEGEEEGEEEDGRAYGKVPGLLGQVVGTQSSYRSEPVGIRKFKAEGAVGDRWEAIRSYILSTIGEASGTFHVIISHDAHEMAVRFAIRDGEATGLVAVETETSGIRNCASWEAAGAIIGAWLTDQKIPAPEDGSGRSFEVDIRRQVKA